MANFRPILLILTAMWALAGCKRVEQASAHAFSEIQIVLLLLTCLLLFGALIANHKRRQAVAQTQEAFTLLREQEQHYRGLVESVNAVTWEMSLTGMRFIYVSQHAETMLGLPRSRWLEPNFLFGQIYPDDLDWVKEHLLAKVALNQDHQFDFRMLNDQGQPQWLRNLVSCIRDKRGQVTGLRGVIVDIHEQKSVEQALLQSEQKFSRAFQASPDALILSRLDDGKLLDVNRGFTEMTGHDRADAIGRTTLELQLWHDPADRFRMIETLQRTGSVRDMRAKIVTATGRVREVEISTEPMLVEDQPCLLSITRDVTERLAMEDSLRQAATVFESTLEGVIICSADSRVLAINNAFTRITGYEAQDVIGQPLARLQGQVEDLALTREIRAILDSTGHWQGETWNRRRNGELYAAWVNISRNLNPDGGVDYLVLVFSDITPLKHSQARLDHQAHHDPLTGLPNRLLFEARLREALHANAEETSPPPGALLFIDLDRFKQINDSLGHHIGDVLLTSVSTRLRQALRDTDTVARHGGDEFIVLVPRLQQEEDAGQIAEKLLAVFRHPITAEGHEFFVSASIGISLFPDDGCDVNSLIKHADAAMYRAKNQGRNRYEYYTRDLTADAQQRMELENELRRGLDRKEFILHYQPKQLLKTGELFGVEALVRWQHPQWGLVEPSQFIPLAEETGLIVELGKQILHQSCAQLADWLNKGFDPVLLAVNVSGAQLVDRQLIDEIARALTHYNIPAEKLELEITEDFVMNRNRDSVGLLHELRDMGLSLSIDDFGTGYSSLNYLKELPLQTLKIDRSFVAGLPEDKQDTAISQTIIVLAHNLGMTVVAEGVETHGQRAALQQQGCDAVQGFLISEPMTADRFAEQFLRLSA
jgi:diguanylate cyclase (GGDEF)-like protein/PAS domain S-box-containing protein